MINTKTNNIEGEHENVIKKEQIQSIHSNNQLTANNFQQTDNVQQMTKDHELPHTNYPSGSNLSTAWEEHADIWLCLNVL